MPKWNGGVIGVANNPTQSSAKGIWSLSEATKAIRAGLWPPSNAGADPYFENVTLLLPGDGTNGAQNNTFLDSSTNNFTITRNGNTTQGTFTPFSKADGRWSNYFDGTGDFLSVANNAAFNFGSGAFTIEFWYYPTTLSGTQCLITNYGGSTTGFVIQMGGSTAGSGKIDAGFSGDGADITSTNGLTANTWNHIAISGTPGATGIKLFINGAQEGSTYTGATSLDTSSTLLIGEVASTNRLSGYLSGLRLLKGTAQYTTAFTPPTAPLTAITNTSLLTCQSNRFIDNSTNAFAITRNGDVAVTTFSPFPTLTAYAAGTNGGSGYFDGTGDYLTVADSATLEPGSSDFTIECWIYPTATGSYLGVFSKRTNNATDYSPIQILINSGTMILLASTTGSSWAVNANASTSPPLNAWSHIAVVRNGTASNNLVLYLNGVSVATGSVSNTALVNNAGAWAIAADSDDGGGNFVGYISGFRYVLGSAVYTSGFTPPTAPPTAVTNTSLLTNFTNGGIIDTSMFSNLETVGNAQISTTQSKFGGGSMSFDGTGDALVVYDPSYENSPGGGDFTFECWVYFNALPGAFSAIYHLKNDASTSTTVFIVEISSTGKLSLSTGIATIIDGTAGLLTTGSWIHIAVTRASGTLRTFVNGTQDKSASNTTTYNGSYDLFGVWRYSGSDNYLNAYIDDLRITKGYARYTANFTPPTGPFVGFGD